MWRPTLNRRDPIRSAYIKALARNRMLERDLRDTMESVVEQETDIMRLEEQLAAMRAEVDKATAEEDESVAVPVTSTEACACAGCCRSRAERALRELTPLHALQMRGVSFGVPWGMG